MTELKKNWYVISVKAGTEAKLQEKIKNKVKNIHGIELSDENIIIPMSESQGVNKQGEACIIKKKSMPGYMYLNLDLTDELWDVIKEFTIKKSHYPQKVSESAVLRNLEQIASESKITNVKNEYSIGETVLITDGPFEDFSGVIDTIVPEKGSLMVSISIFGGKNTPVEFKFHQIKKKD